MKRIEGLMPTDQLRIDKAQPQVDEDLNGKVNPDTRWSFVGQRRRLREVGVTIPRFYGEEDLSPEDLLKERLRGRGSEEVTAPKYNPSVRIPSSFFGSTKR